MSKILIVDDEPSICWGLSRLAEGLGHQVRVASSAEQGLADAAEDKPDLLVLDVRLPGMDGLAAMGLFRRILGAAPIIVITAFGDLATAVRAVEQGAFEYVLKPFDLQEIRAAVERALSAAPAVLPLAAAAGVDGMLGESPPMQAVFKRIALAAASDASVLLFGESGVGKELAASAIHRHSARRDAPFVAVNIAALSPTLAEAELFGHVAGAFTGANYARKGLLVEANGGTLFLDEVAEIPAAVQVKLLRVLDRGEVLPVGADRPQRTQFRLISATHQPLARLVESGHFRHDLFYRLNSFEIPLPPLRERPQDIPLLAKHFVLQLGGGAAVLADETIAELERRRWYGNVRELRMTIDHALVLARTGTILPDHLPPPMQAFGAAAKSDDSQLTAAAATLASKLLADPAAAGAVYDQFLHEVERPLLSAAMAHAGQQCAPAARILGLHRTTLRRKLDQHSLAVEPDPR